MKEKERKPGNLRRISVYAGRYIYLTYASMVLSACSMIAQIVPFYYIWRIMQELLDHAPAYDEADVVDPAIRAIAFLVLGAVLYFAALMCSHVAAFNTARRIRTELMEHAIELPLGAFDEIGSGKARRTVQETVGQTETFLAHNIPDMAAAAVLPFAMVAIMLYFDWRFGALCLVVIALSMIVLASMAFSKPMMDRMKEMQADLDDMNREGVEYVRGIGVVKTFQQTLDSFKTFKASIDMATELMEQYAVLCRWRMVLLVCLMESLSLFLIIGALAINGTDTVTDTEFICDFAFYTILTPLVAALLLRLMHIGYDGQVAAASIDRIDEMMAMSPLPEPTEPRMPDGTEVVFDDVSFTYEGASHPAVDHLNLTMKPGTITALVGPSGSGKSTVASLACRFWDPQSGSVSIGGVDLRDIGTDGVCRLTSFVFQSNSILKGTLRDNVRMGRTNASDDEILAAMEGAQCGDILEKMPDGLDTVLGPGGVHLSGGEVQRGAPCMGLV